MRPRTALSADPSDVIIVGAGPSGCLLTDRLRDTGLTVQLLEAAPRPGGRSLDWGGWSFRFSAHGFRRAGWPFGLRAMAPSYAAVEERLNIVEGALQERHVRLARALGVRVLPKRAPLIGDRIWTAGDTRAAKSALTDTVAVELVHDRRTATSLRASRSGRAIELRARAFVLAASALETARILLRSRADRRVGRGLVDHLVASAVLWSRQPPSRSHGPLDDSVLISNVVNEGRGTQRRYRGGFSIEVVGPLRVASAGIQAPPGARSATMIHAIGEMFPSPLRRVELTRVRMPLTTEDRMLLRDMDRACVRIADALAQPGSDVTMLESALGGHEAGTCSGIVDRFGRMRALRNVWIADSSVMPTAGDRHPTLTILAHGERVAVDVVRRLKS